MFSGGREGSEGGRDSEVGGVWDDEEGVNGLSSQTLALARAERTQCTECYKKSGEMRPLW